MTLTDEQITEILNRIDRYYSKQLGAGEAYRDICDLAAAYRALNDDNAALRHDIARHVEIANEHLAEIERLREIEAEFAAMVDIP